MEFRGLRAGDDFDDVRSEWWGDLDFESTLVCAGDINCFVGGYKGVAAPAVWEEDDGTAIALVADDRDMAFFGAADSEADVFALCVGSLAIGGEDLNLEILWKLGQPAFGDFLDVGEALFDVLGLHDVFHVLRRCGCRIRPDFGFHFVERDGEPGLADLSAFQPGEFGIDGDVFAGIVEASANDPFDPLYGDLFNAGAGFEDLLALELSFQLQVGEAVAGDDLEFPGFAEGNFEFVAQEGGKWREEVGIFVGKVAYTDVHFVGGRET